jgi:hypothetical protein
LTGSPAKGRSSALREQNGGRELDRRELDEPKTVDVEVNPFGAEKLVRIRFELSS